MSETISAPLSSPNADSPADISPAPATQPRLSIADAMNRLRGQPTGQPEQEGGRTGGDSDTLSPPRDARGRFTASEGAEQSQQPDARRASGVEAMEQALGLRPAEAPGATPEAPEGAAAPTDSIEVDGRRYSLDEFRGAMRRDADYTRKTQELAQQRNQLQAQAQQVQAQQQAIDQFLPMIQPEVTRLQAMLADAPMPDAMLRQTDPPAYWEAFARHQDAIAAHQRFFGMLQQQEATRAQQMQQAVDQANAELASRYSFWANEAQRAEVQTALVDWARGVGFQDHELRGLSNPLYLETMMKAMAHDASVGKVRTAAPEPTVRATPRMGAAPPPRPAEAVAAASAAFGAKPSWQNGAALLTAQQAADRRGNGHRDW